VEINFARQLQSDRRPMASISLFWLSAPSFLPTLNLESPRLVHVEQAQQPGDINGGHVTEWSSESVGKPALDVGAGDDSDVSSPVSHWASRPSCSTCSGCSCWARDTGTQVADCTKRSHKIYIKFKWLKANKNVARVSNEKYTHLQQREIRRTSLYT